MKKGLKWKLIVALCILCSSFGGIILIFLLILGADGGKNALAASANSPERLEELAKLSEYGIPSDIIFMITTMQCKTEQEALEKPFIFNAMEFMEMREFIHVYTHVCSDDDDSDDKHEDCGYKLSSIVVHQYKGGIKVYLGITDEENTDLDAYNLEQKLQEEADRKANNSGRDEIRQIEIIGIPSSLLAYDDNSYSEYRKAIERCGITDEKDIDAIIELHDARYFMQWIEASADSFGLDLGSGNSSGPFVTGSNGTHAHISNLIMGDTTPFEGGSFTSPIPGNWRSQVTCEIYGYQGHTGIDFGVAVGTPVYAAADGTVLYVSTTPGPYSGGYNAYGIHIVINHGGKITSLYAHNSQALVTAGQHVTAGELIARSGNTGNVKPVPTPSNPTSGAHLHFEVIVNGTPKNPRSYLP